MSTPGSPRIRRALALAAALAAAVVSAACGATPPSAAGPNHGLAPITLRIPVTAPNTAILPIYVAVEEGFLEEEGFQTSYVNVATGAAMLPAMLSNETDIVTTSIPVLLKVRQQGGDVQALTGWTIGINSAIYVRNGVNVPLDGTFEEKMTALGGLRIGALGGADGTAVPFMKAMIRLGGGDPDSLVMPNLAYGGPQIAALQSGEVDAVLADDATQNTANQLGLGHAYFSLITDPPADYKGLMTSVVGVTSSTLAQHPDLGPRLTRAFTKTFDFMKAPANADELRRVATGVMGLPDSPQLPRSLQVQSEQMKVSATQPVLERTLDFIYRTNQAPA
jgi:ABC-type nitrate/sulfonate/bicarbonate transport system substrate-binding protein